MIFTDRPVNLLQLNAEIEPMLLPDFTGTARLSRDLDTKKPVPPFILVKVGELDAAQDAALTTVMDAHVPAPPPLPTADELRLADLHTKLARKETLTAEETSELMRIERGL